jgi:hypothetical protein
MLKGVLLAWLLCRRKGRVVGVAVLGGYVSTRIYQRVEGKETYKYTAIICNTEHDILECSAALHKDMSKPF